MTTTLFHITPARNLPAIFRAGLAPMIGERSAALGETSAQSYHFPDWESLSDALTNWLGEQFDEDETLALLAVKPQGLELESDAATGFEVRCTETIPPDALSVLALDIDDCDWADLQAQYRRPQAAPKP